MTCGLETQPTSTPGGCHLFFDAKALEMLVGFGKLLELRVIVIVGLRHLKLTSATRHVCLDVGENAGLLQSAPDRGGTSISRHVRYFEHHNRGFGRFRRDLGVGGRRARPTSCQRSG